jgi:hypothetical protein
MAIVQLFGRDGLRLRARREDGRLAAYLGSKGRGWTRLTDCCARELRKL